MKERIHIGLVQGDQSEVILHFVRTKTRRLKNGDI